MNINKPRYNCSCDPSLYNDMYSCNRQIEIELPKWSYDRKVRLRLGLTSTIRIDNCIVGAIKELWSKGIEIKGCCCGHNIRPAWVEVHPAWYEDMFRYGYKQKHPEVVNGHVKGLNTFYL